MDTSTSDSPVTDLKPGSMPFYVNDPADAKDTPKTDSVKPKIDLTTIPQGVGSGLDADKVDGIDAVSSSNAGPNVLVSTSKDGILPNQITDPYTFWSTFQGM